VIPSKRTGSEQPDKRRGCCFLVLILAALVLIYFGSLIYALSGWNGTGEEEAEWERPG
jgi:hypothetical protein